MFILKSLKFSELFYKGNPLNMNYSDSQFRDFLTNPFQNLIIDLSNATLLEVIESLTTVKFEGNTYQLG